MSKRAIAGAVLMAVGTLLLIADFGERGAGFDALTALNSSYQALTRSADHGVTA